jgi:hypothetical protein
VQSQCQYFFLAQLFLIFSPPVHVFFVMFLFISPYLSPSFLFILPPLLFPLSLHFSPSDIARRFSKYIPPGIVPNTSLGFARRSLYGFQKFLGDARGLPLPCVLIWLWFCISWLPSTYLLLLRNNSVYFKG